MINKFSEKEELDIFLKKNYSKKIFLLCGEKSFKNSGANFFFKKFLRSKNLQIFFKKKYLPELQELKLIIKKIDQFEPNLIIAIGGGSVIDYAKISNIVKLKSNLEKLISNYSYPYDKKKAKLIVIPTTAGSGAEVTSNAVIYINKIKYSLESELLIPDKYFLIPEFIIKSPKKIKSSAGFDAIAQSMESLISKKSNNLSVQYATQSLKISSQYFLRSLQNPSLNNVGKMCIAANLSGKAINISKTTAPHALSYPFSAYFNMSHGHAVSLFFERFLKYNFDNYNNSTTSFDLLKRYEILFKIFKVKNINQLNYKISSIKKKSNLIDDLNKLNIDTNKYSKKIIKGVNILRLSNNPVSINEDVLKKIICLKK